MTKISSFAAGGSVRQRANMNGNQGGGPKKQGLASSTNRPASFSLGNVKSRYYSNSRQRAVISRVNQLGGIGGKSKMFGPSSDGINYNTKSIKYIENQLLKAIQEIENTLDFHNKHPNYSSKVTINIDKHVITIEWVKNIEYDSNFEHGIHHDEFKHIEDKITQFLNKHFPTYPHINFSTKEGTLTSTFSACTGCNDQGCCNKECFDCLNGPDGWTKKHCSSRNQPCHGMSETDLNNCNTYGTGPPPC